MTVKKDKSTPENREFWKAVSKAAETVNGWPEWKKGGQNMLRKEDLKSRYLDNLDRENLTIDWARIGRAIDFYKSLGYQYIEAPWIVEEQYRKITYPHQIAFATDYGDLVGSAEQSFIALHFENRKRNRHTFTGRVGQTAARFVACTPCFRDHQPNDRYHMPYFMKVELFELETEKPGDMFHDAGRFFASEGALPEMVKTEEGMDWFVGGIEVGSYGQRSVKDHDGILQTWNYATGLAEPRFSQALKQQRVYLNDKFKRNCP